MKTSQAILNDRTKKKKSPFHKICTFEDLSPHFESEEIHSYEYSHTKTPAQHLVFHKEAIRPTPISLPTPPASPEFWGTSLHKWYQKKPLFTLTAKGQVKRIEKYLQIQKTIEMCKKEYEFQVQTENMKKAYIDFEFREHQPLLFEDKDVCCVCPCNSSRKYDVDFIPVDYVSCSPRKPKICICPGEDQMFDEVSLAMQQDSIKQQPEDANYQSSATNTNHNTGFIEEARMRPKKMIRRVQNDSDDRGIHKIIVKNKEMSEKTNDKYMMQIYDNKNFEKDETVQYMGEKSNAFYKLPNFKENDCKSGLSRMAVGNIATLPFDYIESPSRSPRSDYRSRRSCVCCHSGGSRKSSCCHEGKYDMNRNEISYNINVLSSDN